MIKLPNMSFTTHGPPFVNDHGVSASYRTGDLIFNKKLQDIFEKLMWYTHRFSHSNFQFSRVSDSLHNFSSNVLATINYFTPWGLSLVHPPCGGALLVHRLWKFPSRSQDCLTIIYNYVLEYFSKILPSLQCRLPVDGKQL